MKIGIHQPNFNPWLAFYYKLKMCDRFIILSKVQFEKGGYQNRYRSHSGSWVTMPVQQGMDLICNKFYKNGLNVHEHNTVLIRWMMDTLDIGTELVEDIATDKFGTDRLVANLNHYGATSYVTNPEAIKKYLEPHKLKEAGIDIVGCIVPKDLQIPIWEALDKFGIEGTKKQLERAFHEQPKSIF